MRHWDLPSSKIIPTEESAARFVGNSVFIPDSIWCLCLNRFWVSTLPQLSEYLHWSLKPFGRSESHQTQGSWKFKEVFADALLYRKSQQVVGLRWPSGILFGGLAWSLNIVMKFILQSSALYLPISVRIDDLTKFQSCLTNMDSLFRLSYFEIHLGRSMLSAKTWFVFTKF